MKRSSYQYSGYHRVYGIEIVSNKYEYDMMDNIVISEYIYVYVLRENAIIGQTQDFISIPRLSCYRMVYLRF